MRATADLPTPLGPEICSLLVRPGKLDGLLPEDARQSVRLRRESRSILRRRGGRRMVLRWGRSLDVHRQIPFELYLGRLRESRFLTVCLEVENRRLIERGGALR
jgi:hypothetical protein